MKYAIEFQFDVYEDKEIEPDYDTVVLISDYAWLDDAYDFDTDYWDLFVENYDIKSLKVGRHHAFAYGDVIEEWSENHEYGREFDGFLFEPEFTNVVLLK